jgi:hypothetical protein
VKAFRAASAFFDDYGFVLLYQLGEELDAGIDIVLVTAQGFVQHLQPRIANPAIGRNGDAALVFRV